MIALDPPAWEQSRLDTRPRPTWWQRHAPTLALLACWLLGVALFTPTVRLATWLILWACYLAGTTPDAPPCYTPWAPHLMP